MTAQAWVEAEEALAQLPQQARLSSDARGVSLPVMRVQSQACSALLTAVEQSFPARVRLALKVALGKQNSPAAPVDLVLLPDCLQAKASKELPLPAQRTQKFSQGVP